MKLFSHVAISVVGLVWSIGDFLAAIVCHDCGRDEQ
jgi:hypothetical protein